MMLYVGISTNHLNLYVQTTQETQLEIIHEVAEPCYRTLELLRSASRLREIHDVREVEYCNLRNHRVTIGIIASES